MKISENGENLQGSINEVSNELNQGNQLTTPLSDTHLLSFNYGNVSKHCLQKGKNHQFSTSLIT